MKSFRAACCSLLLAALLAIHCSKICSAEDAPAAPLRVAWSANTLSIESPPGQPAIPGGKLLVNYLEAYCRAGSTDRDWRETVIKHVTRQVSADADGHAVELECTLADGVLVHHKITSGVDSVDFRLVAQNPTATASQAHWAQPCIRVGSLTGRPQQEYLALCFVLIDGKATRLPTEPWATMARYVPGQVYCPANVNRNDVNPRPVSSLVPSHGLIGCFSADARWIVASAWEPYQELFQGVATCVHSDFRIGGLKPGETKQIRGKIYVTRDNIDSLVKRYEREFSEHFPAKGK